MFSSRSCRSQHLVIRVISECHLLVPGKTGYLVFCCGFSIVALGPYENAFLWFSYSYRIFAFSWIIHRFCYWPRVVLRWRFCKKNCDYNIKILLVQQKQKTDGSSLYSLSIVAIIILDRVQFSYKPYAAKF